MHGDSHRGRATRRPTIKDVALDAGVSYSTVSRVVTGQNYIAGPTRDRVQDAMRRLGYVADIRARSLAGGRTRILGLITHDIESSFMAGVVRAIDAEVSLSGYDMMLWTTHSRNRTPSEYVTQMAAGLVDGLLVMLPDKVQDYVGALHSSGLPHVVIDYDGPPIESTVVRVANHQGITMAVEHLVELGHRRIGLISGLLDTASAQSRRDAFSAAVAANPLVHGSIAHGSWTEHGGFAGASELLDAAERPTAIIASNDIAAFGALRAAHERRIAVPSELSLIGFDDIPEAQLMTPPLSTIRQPFREIGREATRLLVERVEGRGEIGPVTVELPTEMIVRASTAPPPPPAEAGGESMRY